MHFIRKLQNIRVARYLFVGCSSFAVELGSLLAMVHALGFSATAATAVAYWIGLLMAFGLQKVFAFQDYRRELKVLTRQGAVFAVLTLWNWLFTIWFVSLFSDGSIIVTRSIAIVVMSGWNYFIYKNIIFKNASATPSRLLNHLATDKLLHISAILVLMWRVLLEVVNQLVAYFTANTEALRQWANWDGGWYINIQHVGYLHSTPVTSQENVAFFPAFPHIVGQAAKLLHLDPIIFGLALNTLITVGIVYMIMRLAIFFAKQLNIKQAERLALLSGALFLALPASFFFAAYYAEAMLIFGVLGATYFAFTKRLWFAVPCMMLATASKVMGVIAVITVLVIVLEQWRREHGNPLQLARQWAVSLLGLSGLAGYMAYLWIKFGDPILFYTIQKSWGRNEGGFFATRILKNYYAHFFDPGYFGGRFGYILNLVLMVTPFVVGAVAFYAWRKYKMVWPLVLGFLALALPLSTGIMDSLYRYAMVSAPLIPFAVLWMRTQKRAVLYGAFIGSLALMLMFAAVFLAGDYFAG